MNSKIKYIALFLMSTLIFLYFGWFVCQRITFGEDIYCTGNTTTHLNQDQVKVSYTVRMHNGTGVVNVVGQLYKSDEINHSIGRQVNFKYTRIGKDYHIISTAVRRSNLDTAPDELISKYMSDFYTKAGDERYFDIFPVNQEGWVFNMNSTPYVLCIKDVG